MSTAYAVLPVVWATAVLPETPEHKKIARGLSFYRRYTEALLRRYVKMSMEAGRSPSLLGREMFHGKVTSYRIQSFEDVVIFVHDVEKCLAKLDTGQQQLIARIAMQEYTFGQPGRLTQLEGRVEQHEQTVQRMKGLAGAFAGMLTLIHLMIDYVRR